MIFFFCNGPSEPIPTAFCSSLENLRFEYEYLKNLKENFSQSVEFLETQESCSVQATDISALVFQHEIWMKIVFASIFVTKTFMFQIVLHSLLCIIMKLCVIFSP